MAEAELSAAARAALYAGGFLGPFGGAMVTVLIPELRDAFDVSTGAIGASITVYMIPFAGLQLVSGTIGERLGVARVTRVAFLMYVVASTLCAVAGSIGLFLGARVVQGAANAFTTPLVLSVLAASTPEASLGRTMGTFSA